MHPAVALAEQFGAHNYHPLDVVLVRGEGEWVWDDQGRRYLDGLSAYSAVNQGHCHPRIARALTEQAHRITLTSRAFHNDRMGPFLQRLCEYSGFERALLMNSGAEAVETAIKAVRKWGYAVKGVPADQAEIIWFDGNFHGRTTTIVGFSSEAQYRHQFGPFDPGHRRVPYGDIDALRAAVTERTVAVIAEPIQGEAGVVVPPPGWLRAVRELCTEQRVLFVLDEIQTGLCRTGRRFAFEHEGVRPDAITVGKALSGGFYPISAFLASDEVMSVFRPGDHGSTFGGNPLACAVGEAALQVLVDERLDERAAALGESFLARLRALNSPKIREVRGQGLLIGVELREDAGRARAYCEALMARGVLCKDTHAQVIRFAPPLVVEAASLDVALEQFAAVLA